MASTTTRTAASPSKSADTDKFIEMIKRLPRDTFIRAVSKMDLTTLESRELVRLFTGLSK